MDTHQFSELKKTALIWRFDQTSDRIDRIIKVKTWLQNNETAITDALYADFKKPAFETTISEILPTLSEINYIQSNLKKWMKDQKVPTPMTLFGHSSRIRSENKGVVLVIAPWNYPFQLAIIPLITAIAAGNTVVVKPSEMTPQTSSIIARLVNDCFSSNEVIVELGDKEKTTELLGYHFDHVFFTGSTAVGRIIAKACAERLIPTTLELGGKSPTIIDETANIKVAAEKIFWGKYLNRGQTCVAPDYILVHEKVKDEIIQELNQLNTIHQHDEKGQIINGQHQTRLSQLSSTKLESTLQLVVSASLNSPVMKDEIFGPVLPIITFSDIEEVITTVRKYDAPLSLYVFSKNQKFIEQVLRALPSGGVGINSVLLHLANHHLPFGGVGASGMGKYHGYFGFQELSHQRAILEHKYFPSLRKLMQPPYTPLKEKMVNLFKKFA